MKRRDFKLTLSNEDILEVTVEKADVNPIGIVHILHGMAEHKDRYDNLASYLLKRGFHVIRHNHPGHGKSIKKSARGHFRSIDQLTEDVKEVADTLRNELNKDLPYILIGHSMGSLVARKYAHDYPNDINVLVLSGTVATSKYLLRLQLIGLTIVKTLLGKSKKYTFINNMATKTISKKHKNLNKDNAWLSVSTKNRETYTNDQYSGFKMSNLAFYEIIKTSIESIKPSFLKKINKNLPILLISGKEDHIGNFGEGIKKLALIYKRNGIKHVTIQLYKNNRHEVFFEDNHALVYERLYTWLTQQLNNK